MEQITDVADLEAGQTVYLTNTRLGVQHEVTLMDDPEPTTDAYGRDVLETWFQTELDGVTHTFTMRDSPSTALSMKGIKLSGNAGSVKIEIAE